MLSRWTAHPLHPGVSGPRQRPDGAHWNETTKELLPLKMRLAYHPRDGKLLAIPFTMGQDSICRGEKTFLKVDSSEVSSGAAPLDSPGLALGLSPAAAGGR